MTARLLVSGSRLLTAERHAAAIEEGLIWAGKLLGRDTVLVHGACPPAVRADRCDARQLCEGADELARRRWARWGLPLERHPASWSNGIRAGFDRNQAMVDTMDLALPCLAMAWPHPDPRERSAGTWDCVRRALAAQLTVLNGWTLQPILEVPVNPPLEPYAGPMPHRDAVAALV